MTSVAGNMLYQGTYVLANAILHSICYWYGIKYEAIGRENIPKVGEGAIFAANHSKSLEWNLFGKQIKKDSIDHILLGPKTGSRILFPNRQIYTFAMEHFFESDEGFLKKLGAFWCRETEQIPFSESREGFTNAKKMAHQLLDEGKIIAIYSGYSHLDNQKSKIPAKLTLQRVERRKDDGYTTIVPIVPVQIKVIGRDGKEPLNLLHRNTAAIQVIFKKPIDVVSFALQHCNETYGKQVRELTDLIWRCVYN